MVVTIVVTADVVEAAVVWLAGTLTVVEVSVVRLVLLVYWKVEVVSLTVVAVKVVV